MNFSSGSLEKLEKTNNESLEKLFSFVRTLITIGSGLIAVLVSLKSKSINSKETNLLFASTIAALSLGILFGAILLYQDIRLSDKLEKKLSNHISKELEANRPLIFFENASAGWIFSFSKWSMIISFSISLLLLTFYSYYSN